MDKVSDLITKYYRHVRFGQQVLEDEIACAILKQRGLVLDAGCGADAPLTRKFGAHATVIGVDLCLASDLPRSLFAIHGDLGSLPFPNETFSLIFSRSVFEHITDPEKVLLEFHRVLAPGGICLIQTPSAWDYASIIARVTPQKFHDWYVGRIFGEAAYDTFPVVYRANTSGYYRRFIRRQQGKWLSLQVEGLRHYPCYLGFSRILFRLGVGYDWLVAGLGLTNFHPTLHIKLTKAAPPQLPERGDNTAHLTGLL